MNSKIDFFTIHRRLAKLSACAVTKLFCSIIFFVSVEVEMLTSIISAILKGEAFISIPL